VETAALSLNSQPKADAASREAHALLGLSGPAYRLAMRILGSPQNAEDMVQGAYVVALERLGSDSPPLEMRTWFLGIVANLARLHRRRQSKRREKEAVMWQDRAGAPAQGADLGATLGGAMAMLDEKYRLPVSLCYEEGLTQRETAAILKLPERTISDHVQVGLAKLRKALERAGYPAAVAAVLGGLKSTAPAVPASLAGRVEALVAQSAMKTGTGAAAAASAVAKGGIAMKLIAGLVFAGVVAAGVAVVSGRRGGAPLPAGAPAGGDWRNERWTLEDFTNVRGGGPTFGPAVQAGGAVYQLCGDKDGNLFLANNYTVGTANTIDIVTPDGMRFRLAGTGVRGYRDGPARQAQFDHADRYVSPIGLRADDRGNLFLADNGNRVIRRIYRKGEEWFVDTWVGGGKRAAGSLKGGGAANPREMALFGAIAAAPDGHLTVACRGTGFFRVAPDGKSVTFLGPWPKSAGGGKSSVILGDCDRAGNAYFISCEPVTSSVVRVAADGKIDHMAGLPVEVMQREKKGARKPHHIGDGPPLTAYIDTPQSSAADPAGACVYTCGGDEYDIRRLPTDGATTTSVLLQNGRWAALKVHPNKNRPREKPCVVNPALKGQPRTEGGKLGNLCNCHIAGRDYGGNLYGFLYPWRGVTLCGPDGQLLRTSLYRVRRVK